MTSKLKMTDRLRDRGFVDQWGFVAFAAAGFVAIFCAKALGARTTWVAVGAIAAMMAYAAIIARSGTGRVRADQAGDNCYYLGLVYTLASLSYAIATFNPSDTGSTIVQGFGVALATTIVGLILRVFFSQGRPDLENVEEQTRLELTDAVVRLKSELGDVVRRLSDFTGIVEQSMNELQKSTTEQITEFASSSVQSLRIVVDAAASTIRDEANDFAARSKRYSTSFDRLLGKLEKHAESVDQMREAQEIVRATAQAAESAVGAAGTAIGSLQASAEGVRAAAASTQDAIGSVKDLVAGLSTSVEKMKSLLHDIHQESTRRMEELRAGPSQDISDMVAALAQATGALKSQLSDADKLHAEVNAGIAARSESALEATRRFNEKLEEELARSGELVGKVHSSLADMTSKLAQSVENPV